MTFVSRGWQIAVDVASALVFLHSKGLLHLDVKSLNILLKVGPSTLALNTKKSLQFPRDFRQLVDMC